MLLQVVVLLGLRHIGNVHAVDISLDLWDKRILVIEDAMAGDGSNCVVKLCVLRLLGHAYVVGIFDLLKESGLIQEIGILRLVLRLGHHRLVHVFSMLLGEEAFFLGHDDLVFHSEKILLLRDALWLALGFRRRKRITKNVRHSQLA